MTEANLVNDKLSFTLVDSSGNTGIGAIYHNKGIKYGTKEVFSFNENGVLTINEDVKQSTTFIKSETTYINDHIFNIGSSTGAVEDGKDAYPFGISVGGLTGNTGPPAAEFLYYPESNKWQISATGGNEATLTGLLEGVLPNDAVNRSQLSSEESNRVSDVGSLDTRLSNEESNRTSDVGSLDTRLSSGLSSIINNTTVDPTYIAVGNGQAGLTGFSNFTWDNSAGLGVTGAVKVNGDITSTSVTCTSDKKLKTNIEDLDNSEVIHLLRSVKYKWVDTKKDQRKKYGFIAQEVQEVLPDIVNNGSGTLSIDYIQLISHLVKEVQKLRSDVDEIKKM